jgi:hypothetical protein
MECSDKLRSYDSKLKLLTLKEIFCYKLQVVGVPSILWGSLMIQSAVCLNDSTDIPCQLQEYIPKKCCS